MAVNKEANDEQMAGRAWIRWSDISVEPSDLPRLRWEKASTTRSSKIETDLRLSAERIEERGEVNHTQWMAENSRVFQAWRKTAEKCD